MIEDNMTLFLINMLPLISFPPDSDHLPVALSHPDSLFLLFDVLIHWTAYFIACIAVTISLLICMAIVLFSFICLFELFVQTVSEIINFIKR
jgi:hypothetical protein